MLSQNRESVSQDDTIGMEREIRPDLHQLPWRGIATFSTEARSAMAEAKETGEGMKNAGKSMATFEIH